MKYSNLWYVHWRNDTGWYYGKVLNENPIFYAANLAKLTPQIKKAFQKEEMELLDIEGEPECKQVCISLLHSHTDRSNKYSLPFSVELNISAIIYRIKKIPFYYCELPYLSIIFTFDRFDKFEQLARYYVSSHFQDLSIQEWLQYCENKSIHLEKIKIRLPDNSINQDIEKESELFEDFTGIVDRIPKGLIFKKSSSLLPTIAWNRENEILAIKEDIIHHKNFIILGDKGSGKSIILQNAIERAYRQDEKIKVFKTDPKKLISRSKYLGEWQQECESLIEQIVESDYQIILYMENFTELLHTGGNEIVDSVAAYLYTFIQNKQLVLLAELTLSEYERAYFQFPSFMELFATFRLETMDRRQTFHVMEAYGQELKQKNEIQFDAKVLEESYRLVDKYIHNESQPGKMIRFMSDCANAKMEEVNKQISIADIHQLFQEKTGLPKILFDDKMKLANDELEEYFQKKIVSQDAAIDELSSIIHVFKTGLNDPKKPISSLLFSGPTGVGKTASVKALANYFFGHGQSEGPLFRLDMSEFQDPGQIKRLVGDDPNHASPFIHHVRAHHFSVILFDEIEKADPSFFDVLMAILDEGIFSDSRGQQVNLKSSIIIMTTNLGSEKKSVVGFGESTPDYSLSIRKFFRPEFINRIDKIVFFNSLNQESIRKIVEIELEQINKRHGIRSRNVEIQYSEPLKDWLAKKGYHPLYGARPLKRFIEQTLITSLSRFFLKEENCHNNTLVVDRDKEALLIKTLS